MHIDGIDLVLKRFNAPDVPTRLRRLISPSPARRAWRNAFVLQRLGIATPRPLACIQALTQTLRPVSYLAVEHVPGLSAEAFFLDPDSPVDLKQAVAARIVESVCRLHGAGYIHGDLKGRNIIIHEATPYFIDLDSVRRRMLPPNRRRGTCKDLARLFSTVPAIREQIDTLEDKAAC
ncbi:lipopolysaccharide kinase InaA family protein [Aquisalimonas lutea]|uniref:lipopolysaccharide kinase InaA family protein n=1 Tax=Aquisalimonas lutea TaxID=1327750 RepID=UPI0025B60C36|nr:lipopolysaccharide kinase InaA family protein [Aquisalimonas lutea]MDN3517877.1 lipopolysaccharide kinase InaA family protein [Aquisalimonas lutea]